MSKSKINKIKLSCGICKNDIWKWISQIRAGEGKFCSHKCYAIEKSRRPSVNAGKGKIFNKENKVCPSCKSKKDCRSKLCNKCGGKELGRRQRGRNSPTWIDGRSFLPYSPTWTQQLKDKVRVRDNFFCQECWIPELELSRRLSVHHIDCDKQNNNLSNLISLCIKCHNKIHRRIYDSFRKRK